ncbi:glycosyltransferase family 4 protein [Candidatus Lokiarchaeum ossiferum]
MKNKISISMRIIYFTFEFLEPIFSGNGTVSRLQVFELIKQGHELLVVCAQEQATKKLPIFSEKLSIVAIPVHSQKNLGFSSDYHSYCMGILANQSTINNFDPDCILVVDWHCSEALQKLNWITNIPLIYQFFRCFSRAPEFFDSDQDFQIIYEFEKKIAQMATVCIFLSKDAAYWASSHFKVPTQVVYPPILPNFIENATVHPRSRKILSLANSRQKKVEFIVICRLSPEKEVERVINLCRFFTFSFHLNIYGEPVDLEYASKLRRYVSDYNLDFNITFQGRKNPQELIVALNQSDVYLHPSSYEPFGLTIMEAALCRCLVVLDDTPRIGAGDLLIHKESCLKLNLNKPEQSATVLTKFLSDPKLLSECSNNAYQKSLNLSVEKNIRALIQIFEPLL